MKLGISGGVTGWLLSALAGVCAGVGGYTFYFAKGTAYLSNDPRACVNCHIMRAEYDGWQKASHHAVAVCNDCHTPHDFLGKWLTKMDNGYHHSRAFTLQDFPDVIRIRPRNEAIVQANCRRCHGDFVGEIIQHRGPRGDEQDCIRCHIDVGHGAGQ
jgi:cytochrome c nitrite reductase small subunit